MSNNSEKRVSPVLAITVIAATAVVSIGGSAFYIHQKNKEYAALEAQMPESAITDFFTSLKEKDYSTIYSNAQKIQSSLMSEDSYTEKLQTAFDGIDPDAVKYTAENDGDDDENTASYALTYQNQPVGTMKLIKDADNQWIASVVFESSTDYTVEIPAGLTLQINGMTVGSEYCTATAVPASNFSGLYDQSGVPSVDVYSITNADQDAVFTVEGDDSYTSIASPIDGTIWLGKNGDPSLNQTLIDDAQVLAGFPAADTSLGQVQAISRTDSDWYDRISSMQNNWFTDHTTAEFSNQNVLHLIQQSDYTLLADVVLDYYASNGEVERTWHIGYQMSMINTDGVWKIAGMAINNNMNPGYTGQETK